jgi:hypothetical protein
MPHQTPRSSKPEKEQTMNRYQPSTFRPAFGVAAVALSAITFAFAVVLPVGLAAAYPGDASLAASTPAASLEALIIPGRVDVIASREPRATAFEQVRHTTPSKRGQAG